MAKASYLDLLAKHGIDGAHPGGLKLTKELLAALPINPNSKVLDLGCGTGQTLAYTARTYSCKVIGVDKNDTMLFKSAQRLTRENLLIDLVKADIMDLPFPPDTFDLALSESVTIFTDIPKALREYVRVIKNGGTFLAIEMTAVSPLSSEELDEIKSVYSIGQVPTLQQWEDLLREAGFVDIWTKKVKIRPSFKLFPSRTLREFSPHLQMLNKYKRKLSFAVYSCKK